MRNGAPLPDRVVRLVDGCPAKRCPPRNRADHLGLAQLYQLRGRVGRSHRRAYCYLLVPDRIDEDAERHIQYVAEPIGVNPWNFSPVQIPPGCR